VARAAGGDAQLGERLPRTSRLQHRREFLTAQDGGARFTTATLVLLVLGNALGRRRLGVTVSSRVGNAVVRAKVKRWLRELFRKRRGLLPQGVDAVVIARPAAAGAGLARLERDFSKVAEQAGRPTPRR